MIISTDIEFFQSVYLKTDLEQLERLIIEVKISPPCSLIYGLQCATVVSWHYREEFTTDKNQVSIFTK